MESAWRDAGAGPMQGQKLAWLMNRWMWFWLDKGKSKGFQACNFGQATTHGSWHGCCHVRPVSPAHGGSRSNGFWASWQNQRQTRLYIFFSLLLQFFNTWGCFMSIITETLGIWSFCHFQNLSNLMKHRLNWDLVFSMGQNLEDFNSRIVNIPGLAFDNTSNSCKFTRNVQFMEIWNKGSKSNHEVLESLLNWIVHIDWRPAPVHMQMQHAAHSSRSLRVWMRHSGKTLWPHQMALEIMLNRCQE